METIMKNERLSNSEKKELALDVVSFTIFLIMVFIFIVNMPEITNGRVF